MEHQKIMYLGGHPHHRMVPCEMRTTAFFHPQHQKKQSIFCVRETLDTFKLKSYISFLTLEIIKLLILDFNKMRTNFHNVVKEPTCNFVKCLTLTLQNPFIMLWKSLSRFIKVLDPLSEK